MEKKSGWRTPSLLWAWLFAVCVPLQALAWGAQGHQVIATLAQAQLSVKAKAEVDRLLALEPGETLATISTWADEHRNPASAKWHYVNFPRESCTFDAQRDCPDGKCVVAAIEKQLHILGSAGADERRLAALKYLVHLVGDVHQPLHAGYRDDKGGNKHQLQAFMRGTNLHAVWDTGLIRQRNEAATDMVTRLHRTALPTRKANLSPAEAAEESCRIVRMAGFYPERLVDLNYIKQFVPIMELQLAMAAARLAGLLNNTL